MMKKHNAMINWTLNNNNVELERPKLGMKSGLTYDIREGDGLNTYMLLIFPKNLNWN